MEDNKEKKGNAQLLDTLLGEFSSARNVLLFGEVNQEMALRMLVELTKLNSLDPTAPINMYINSPGGDIGAGFAIIDVMRSIRAPVNTICFSMAASMGAVILAAGNKRYALEHSTIMIHQPLTGMQGYIKNEDINDIADRSNKIRKQVEGFLADSTKGKTTLEEMHKACSKDYYMTAEEALEMGLIDEILGVDGKI